MDFYDLILLSCTLAMDAFAVPLHKGFSVKELNLKHYTITGVYFGGFQALTPAIGCAIDITLASFIASIDHWIAFALLSLIGLKMIKESFENENCDINSNQFGFKIMFALAVATSVDALAIGVSFAFLDVDLFLALFLMGSITSILCAIVLKLGNKFDTHFRNKAESLGGAVLMVLGIKILIEHLFSS